MGFSLCNLVVVFDRSTFNILWEWDTKKILFLKMILVIGIFEHRDSAFVFYSSDNLNIDFFWGPERWSPKNK